VADCKHERVIIMSAKADDRQGYAVPHLAIDKQGYAPFIDGLCGGDYVELTVCLDCGTVVNFKPMDDGAVYEAFEIEPDEEPSEDEVTRSDYLLDELGR
jgi:hypothetical protein